MTERIQKILARAGYGSRRACEQFLTEGRVKVNGRVAVLGEKADAVTDRIELDGRLLPQSEPLVYVAIYKPRGVLSTTAAPDPRPTVVDLVDMPGRLYPVGRLDVDSEGLMLLTNDGELANRLTHPRYGHEKEYRVLVASHPDDEQLATWRRGVVLEDNYRTQPVQVRLESSAGKGAWLRVVMKEGRKRQIRETGSRLGLPVVKIIRVRIGTLFLGSLKPREWRLLTSEEVEALKVEPSYNQRVSQSDRQPYKAQPWNPKPTQPPSSQHRDGSPADKPRVKPTYPDRAAKTDSQYSKPYRSDRSQGGYSSGGAGKNSGGYSKGAFAGSSYGKPKSAYSKSTTSTGSDRYQSSYSKGAPSGSSSGKSQGGYSKGAPSESSSGKSQGYSKGAPSESSSGKSQGYSKGAPSESSSGKSQGYSKGTPARGSSGKSQSGYSKGSGSSKSQGGYTKGVGSSKSQGGYSKGSPSGGGTKSSTGKGPSGSGGSKKT